MAVPSNLFQATAVKGNREDLIDLIFMVSPTETPISTAAGKKKATAVFHEWQRDALGAANADNAAIDGDDAALQAQTPTERVGNYAQIFTKTFGVSGRAEVINKAGRASEIKLLKAKAMKELKRDIEKSIVSNNVAVAPTSSVAPKSGGLGVQLYVNTSHGSGGSTASWVTGAPTTAATAGTARAFTAAMLGDVQQDIYTNSGTQPTAIYMSPKHKRVFSAFGGIAQNRVDTGKKQGVVTAGADVYVGDFGNLEVVPHYLMAGSTNAFILNTDYIDVAFLRDVKEIPLSITGDSQKYQIIMDCALAVRSSAAQGKIADLSGG